MNKYKNKLIFAFFLGFLLLSISVSSVYAASCQCENKSWYLFNYSSVGTSSDLPDSASCNIHCAELSAEYYTFGSNTHVSVSKPTVCVCQTENHIPFKTILTLTSAKECQDTCLKESGRYYNWNGNDGKTDNENGGATALSTAGGNSSSGNSSTAYEPMEEIPGFGKPSDFPTYLMSVYKFGLWAIGICALLMITIGGYMYLGSAGNKATTETAKKIIVDAIAGLILAMVSYLLLYIINPDLVNLTIIK